MLGVPRSASCTISGEMKELAQLGRLEAFLVEKLLSRKERVSLFRNWPGAFCMIPKGGEAIWAATCSSSNLQQVKEENGGEGSVCKHVPYVSITPHSVTPPRDEKAVNEQQLLECYWSDASQSEAEPDDHDTTAKPSNACIPLRSYSFDDQWWLLKQFLPSAFYRRIRALYSTGIAASAQEAALNDHRANTWHNPLESRLPTNAPHLVIYSLYGVGIPTEKSYKYGVIEGEQQLFSKKKTKKTQIDNQQSDRKGEWEWCLKKTPNVNADIPSETHLPFLLDTTQNDPEKELSCGIHCVDGDGTVPTLSLGLMSAHIWRHYKHLNPTGIKTIVREYIHQPPSKLGDRLSGGGPRAADHAGILNNAEALTDIIKIVCDFRDDADDDSKKGPVLKDKIESDILEIAKRIQMPSIDNKK